LIDPSLKKLILKITINTTSTLLIRLFLRNLRTIMKRFSAIHSLLFIYFSMITTTFYAEITRDLELNAVFASIDNTQSQHGQKALRTILANPTSDVATLNGRQAAINRFMQDRNLNTYMHTLLQKFTAQEKHFMRALKPVSDIEKTALKDFYFSSTSLKDWNYSPAYLELGQIAHLGNLCSSMVQHALAFAIFTWALEEEHVCDSHHAKKPHDHKKDHGDKKHVPKIATKPALNTDLFDRNEIAALGIDISNNCEMPLLTTDLYDRNEITMLGISSNAPIKANASVKTHKKDHKHDHGETCSHDHSAENAFVGAIKSLARSPEFRYAFSIWHGVAQIQEIYSIQAIVRKNLKCITEMQTQLMGIARGMNVLNQIYAKLKDYPEITAHLRHYSDLENICTSKNLSKKLNKLIFLLNTKTFKGKPCVFSRIGIILAAYKLIQEIGHELEPALTAIGEIDAYTSCAQLILNSQESSARYSFAQYNTHNKTPMLHAENFWHPLITGNAIQLNSISLGLHDDIRNIVLTGPNACGKSTNLKALTLCAYLAQTITIVPAQYYSQTPCKEIYSSIVVADNIQENKSLFVAELADAEELIIRVEKLAPGEFMIIALDELFKSTHHEKGQNIAYRLLETLYASPQVITLVSTHFEQLIGLAENNSNICTNYTVNRFKLEPGIGFADNVFEIVEKQTRKGRLL